MKKNKKFSVNNFFNKKENVAILAIAVLMGAGIILTNARNNDIPLHDGDILVDSKDVGEQIEMETEQRAGSENGESNAVDNEENQSTSFDVKRANLNMERNELISKYDNTIKNSSNESEKNNAIEQKKKLSKYMEAEINIENIIKSKNLPNTLVIITDSMVNVTVDQQDLKQTTVAKICNIVMDETKRTADKIVIQSSY